MVRSIAGQLCLQNFMAALHISGHLSTALADRHRHTCTAFELPGPVMLSTQHYAAANSLFPVTTSAGSESVYTPRWCLPVASLYAAQSTLCDETHWLFVLSVEER